MAGRAASPAAVPARDAGRVSPAAPLLSARGLSKDYGRLRVAVDDPEVVRAYLGGPARA